MGFTVGVNLSEATNDLRAALATARRLERLGFDAVEFAESAHDAFLPCVLAAEHTALEVHTSVAIAFPRSPMVTAMLAWDMQRYSGGRFVLGLGSQVKGHNVRRFSVPWSAPAPRLREYIGSLRAIWNTFQTGASLDFVGEHYAFTLMTPNFNPGPNEQPLVPVELAAVNANNARVAGQVAEGIKLHPFHSPAYHRDEILPHIDEGLAKTDRRRDQFRIRGGGLIATGKTLSDAEQAMDNVRRWISFYGSTAVYQPVLASHGELDLGERLRAMSMEGRWDEMRQTVTDDVVAKLAIVAPYDRLAGEFRSRYAGIVDHVTLNEAVLDETDDEALAALAQDFQS